MRVAAAFVILLLAGPAGADGTPRALALRGVESYTEALDIERRDERLETFRRAQRLFKRAAETGDGTADLYANLGNAALQAEDLGQAVLAYRRALLLDPGQARALQNLDHARSLLPGWVPRPEAESLLDSFFFWHRTVSRPDRARAAALCFAAAALLIAASIRLRQLSLRNAAILPGLAWLALLASVLADPVAGAAGEAVVTAPELVARAADSQLAPSAFPQPLPAGVELRILERREPWLRVRLGGIRDAWVTASGVTAVGAEGRIGRD